MSVCLVLRISTGCGNEFSFDWDRDWVRWKKSNVRTHGDQHSDPNQTANCSLHRPGRVAWWERLAGRGEASPQALLPTATPVRLARCLELGIDVPRKMAYGYTPPDELGWLLVVSAVAM